MEVITYLYFPKTAHSKLDYIFSMFRAKQILRFLAILFVNGISTMIANIMFCIVEKPKVKVGQLVLEESHIQKLSSYV